MANLGSTVVSKMQLEENSSFTNNLGTLNRSRKLQDNKIVASKSSGTDTYYHYKSIVASN